MYCTLIATSVSPLGGFNPGMTGEKTFLHVFKRGSFERAKKVRNQLGLQQRYGCKATQNLVLACQQNYQAEFKRNLVLRHLAHIISRLASFAV